MLTPSDTQPNSRIGLYRKALEQIAELGDDAPPDAARRIAKDTLGRMAAGDDSAIPRVTTR